MFKSMAGSVVFLYPLMTTSYITVYHVFRLYQLFDWFDDVRTHLFLWLVLCSYFDYFLGNVWIICAAGKQTFLGLHVPSCKSETKFSCCLFTVILEMMGILLAVSSSSSSNP